MAEERWLPVRRYAGFYEASDLGRVYSLPRAATAGGLLALPLNSRGYHVVTLSKYGRTQTLLVARIVLETFDSPADGRRAWHGPKGPGDDSLDNLEWRLPGPRRLPGREREREREHRPARPGSWTASYPVTGLSCTLGGEQRSTRASWLVTSLIA